MPADSPVSHSDAVLSPCGLYRYRLLRVWDDSLPLCAFVMLNPSTADATSDDPTVRRCIGYARAWGCGSLVVVNLFAFRATSPDDMMAAADPVGPDNDRHIEAATGRCHHVVVAWGNHGSFKSRGAEVRFLLRHRRLNHLGLTRTGQPKHPLYLRAGLLPTPLCG